MQRSRDPWVTHNKLRVVTLGPIGDGASQYLMEYMCGHAMDDPSQPITLLIRSPGGEMYETVCCIDAINTARSMLDKDVPINGLVHGFAMSAASVLLMYCDKRFITENSVLMLHGMTQNVRGADDDFLRAQEKVMDGMRKLMVDAYEHRSHLSRQQVVDMMRRNTPTYFTAQEALRDGLVDEVVKSSLPFDDARLIEAQHEEPVDIPEDDPWENV